MLNFHDIALTSLHAAIVFTSVLKVIMSHANYTLHNLHDKQSRQNQCDIVINLKKAK